jgi:phosphotransacetylase
MEVDKVKCQIQRLGQASVLIPDLNTGNNVQSGSRETGALAIGPMLQGLNKPVRFKPRMYGR